MAHNIAVILGIETSGPVASLALWRDGEHYLEVRSQRPFSHAESLNTLLAMLEDFAPLSEIEALGLSLGPGFFTSLRAGAAMAKALAMALELPVVGIPTLKALARDAGEGVVACALDAKKGQVYAGIYRVNGGVEEMSPVEIVLPSVFAARARDLGASLFAGPAAARLGLTPLAPVDRPGAATVAAMAREELEAGRVLDPVGFQPLYVREPDAVAKKRT